MRRKVLLEWWNFFFWEVHSVCIGWRKDWDYDSRTAEKTARTPNIATTKTSCKQIKMKFKIYLMLQSITKSKEKEQKQFTNGTEQWWWNSWKNVSIGAWRVSKKEIRRRNVAFYSRKAHRNQTREGEETMEVLQKWAKKKNCNKSPRSVLKMGSKVEKKKKPKNEKEWKKFRKYFF